MGYFYQFNCCLGASGGGGFSCKDFFSISYYSDSFMLSLFTLV